LNNRNGAMVSVLFRTRMGSVEGTDPQGGI